MRDRKRRTFAVIVSGAATLGALYALEAVLSFANPAWIDQLGTTLRRGPSVVSETYRARRAGIEAYPYIQPDTYVDSANRAIHAGGEETIPLSGLANALTILCNESGTTIGYRSDSLGFRNPSDAWASQEADVALIGDSFTHGFCRPEDETIAARLRRSGRRVINVGLTGAGPLAELGVLREFVSRLRPNDVYWLFYEGNDLLDITSERNTLLFKYLSPGFTQRLFERRLIVDSAVRHFADSLRDSYRPPSIRQKTVSFLLLRKLRTATGLYKQPQVSSGDEREETAILERILEQASEEVKSWGGQLHVVYLPERRRFNKRTQPVVGENHDPLNVQQRIRSICLRLRIPLIDVADRFASQPHPASLWNARRYHYNAAGYAIVADAIRADLDGERK
jgi:lysophospholipase L1-like esterase